MYWRYFRKYIRLCSHSHNSVAIYLSNNLLQSFPLSRSHFMSSNRSFPHSVSANVFLIIFRANKKWRGLKHDSDNNNNNSRNNNDDDNNNNNSINDNNSNDSDNNSSNDNDNISNNSSNDDNDKDMQIKSQ